MDITRLGGSSKGLHMARFWVNRSNLAMASKYEASSYSFERYLARPKSTWCVSDLPAFRNQSGSWSESMLCVQYISTVYRNALTCGCGFLFLIVSVLWFPFPDSARNSQRIAFVCLFAHHGQEWIMSPLPGDFVKDIGVFTAR